MRSRQGFLGDRQYKYSVIIWGLVLKIGQERGGGGGEGVGGCWAHQSS